jgi:hypothetical protein
MKDFFRNIKYYIHNVIKWSPILWRDRDFDYWFIMETLRFKIKNTADHLESHKFFVGWENEVKWMRICEKLIVKITDEYYAMEYLNDNQYLQRKDNNLLKLKVQKICSNLLNEHLLSMYIGMERHEKAKKLLFKIIAEHIEKWWD